MNNIVKPWKRIGDVLKESVSYIEKKSTGIIKSLKSRWRQFNGIGLNGIEWQSLYVIAARPGVGKTLIAATIARDLHQLNKDQDFAILHFNFEMLGRNMGIRELSAANNLDVRYIQSAEDDGMPPLSKEDLEKLKSYVDKQIDREEYIIDKASSVAQMKEYIYGFYNEVGKPIVVTLDHTLLVRQGAGESHRQQTLQNLATMLTEVKNALPVSFIVLTQLNREIDDADRQKPGKLSNYPTEADVYGSDYLLQCADVMIAYNRPAKYNLAQYGPQKFAIEPKDKYLLAAHIIKNRFGVTSIQWYKADYAKMSIEEAPTPKSASFKS